MQPPKAIILPQTILKIIPGCSKSFIQFNIFYVILKSFVCNLQIICMSTVCTRTRIRMSFLCVCNSFVCTRMPFLPHSHVLVCHPYVTRMFSYVIRISLVCHLYSYVIRMPLRFHYEPLYCQTFDSFLFPYFSLNICSLFIYFIFDVLL